MLLVVVCVAGCQKDNPKEEMPATEEQKTGATTQVMVLFAPGQLGDNGYSDAVYVTPLSTEASEGTSGLHQQTQCGPGKGAPSPENLL